MDEHYAWYLLTELLDTGMELEEALHQMIKDNNITQDEADKWYEELR